VIRKLEALANVAIVITSVVLSSVLVKRYFFHAPKPEGSTQASVLKPPVSATSQKRSIQAGTKLSLPGIDWSKSDRTLLLALSTTCHFCSESAPFYQKLQQQKSNDVRLVAVLPQSVEDSKNYLTKLGVSVGEVVQASLASVSVSGTPTLMLIDNNGVIKDSWLGKLADGEAEKFLGRIVESK